MANSFIYSLTHHSLIGYFAQGTQLSVGTIKKRKTRALSSENLQSGEGDGCLGWQSC